MNWIKFTDQLPEDGKTILIANEELMVVRSADYVDEDGGAVVNDVDDLPYGELVENWHYWKLI